MKEDSTMSEFDDEYSESLETEFRNLQGALLDDTVRLLVPSQPLRFTPEHSVARAIEAMVQNRRAAVVVVDDTDRLIGIFTERDVLTRVLGSGRVARDTLLRDVMTPDPESLRSDDRICHAINRMHTGGFRSVPIVDEAHRPIGIITVNDVVRWLAEIFPEAVLNQRPGDRLKNSRQIDAG
jgi:CBS domain-containing protein